MKAKIKTFALVTTTGLGLTLLPLAANALACDTLAGGGSCTVVTPSGTTLTNSTAIGFTFNNIKNDSSSGTFTATGSYTFDATAPAIYTTSLVQFYNPLDPFSGGNPLIKNLVLTMAGVGYQITTDTGQSAGPYVSAVSFSKDFAYGTPVDFSFTGTAVRSSGGTDPQITFNISAVPIPATGFLLLGGLGAFGVMRRRKKASA